MRQRLRDAQHLVRLGLLFAAGIVVFLVLRALFVPATFGDYGHYRGAALGEARALAPVHGGRQACAECHGEVIETKSRDAHARLACEGCHGPLGAHAADPDAVPAERPAATPLCVRCHAANVARPAGHPQVDVAAHAEGADCLDCHAPHAPSP